jgi:hypothetical protein
LPMQLSTNKTLDIITQSIHNYYGWLTIFSDSGRDKRHIRPTSMSHNRPMANAAFIPRPRNSHL